MTCGFFAFFFSRFEVEAGKEDVSLDELRLFLDADLVAVIVISDIEWKRSGKKICRILCDNIDENALRWQKVRSIQTA